MWQFSTKLRVLIFHTAKDSVWGAKMVFLQGFPKKIAFLQKVLKHVFSGLGRPWFLCAELFCFRAVRHPHRAAIHHLFFIWWKNFAEIAKWNSILAPLGPFLEKSQKSLQNRPSAAQNQFLQKKVDSAILFLRLCVNFQRKSAFGSIETESFFV